MSFGRFALVGITSVLGNRINSRKTTFRYGSDFAERIGDYALVENAKELGLGFLMSGLLSGQICGSILTKFNEQIAPFSQG
jgi:hypothetical protein